MRLPPSANQVAPRAVQLPSDIQRAVECLVARLAPVRVYLFGSQARGDATAESDYDLLVIIPDAHPIAAWPGFRRDRLAYRTLIGVGIPKDVLVWTEGEFDARRHWPASLPATVVREGRVLYEQHPHAA